VLNKQGFYIIALFCEWLELIDKPCERMGKKNERGLFGLFKAINSNKQANEEQDYWFTTIELFLAIFLA
jgi:hypothetical protein